LPVLLKFSVGTLLFLLLNLWLFGSNIQAGEAKSSPALSLPGSDSKLPSSSPAV
jgi:hypothetical protein